MCVYTFSCLEKQTCSSSAISVRAVKAVIGRGGTPAISPSLQSLSLSLSFSPNNNRQSTRSCINTHARVLSHAPYSWLHRPFDRLHKPGKEDTPSKQGHTAEKMSSVKVAVVTGSNKGIGLAIVRSLCRQYDGAIYLTAR